MLINSIRRAIRYIVLKKKILSAGFFLKSIALSLAFSLLTSQPITTLLSPLPLTNAQIFSLPNVTKESYQTFSFAPGWSDNKLGQVRVDGLNALAYYDVPVNANGSLNTKAYGYKNFRSKKSADLFAKAQDKNIKVVVTLSITDRETLTKFLSDRGAQEKLVEKTLGQMQEMEIDGVNLSIEVTGAGDSYKGRLTEFVSFFTDQIHGRADQSVVAVSLSDKNINDPLFDIPALTQKADFVFATAATFAVPEINNTKQAPPVFGYGANEYWGDVSTSIGKLAAFVPKDKLIMETAWYGNGNNYPLYKLKDVRDDGSNRNTLKTPLSQEKIEAVIKGVPKRKQEVVRKNLPLIAKALEDEKILNDRVLAYALATIEHETAGTFEPIEEIKGSRSAKRLGYEGGPNYFGRGFIQLTHLRNYKKMGERIGVGDELVKNPDMALQADISAKILAAFFKDNNIAHLATKGDFVRARIPVNPDSHGRTIARLASKYLKG